MTLDDYQKMITAVYEKYPADIATFYDMFKLSKMTGDLSDTFTKILCKPAGLMTQSDTTELCQKLSLILAGVSMMANDLGFSLETIANTSIGLCGSRKNKEYLKREQNIFNKK